MSEKLERSERQLRAAMGRYKRITRQEAERLKVERKLAETRGIGGARIEEIAREEGLV